MKKITTTMIFILLVLTLTGCENKIVNKAIAPYSFVLSKIKSFGNNIVKKSIKQAKTEIENKNYDKALASLELALDEDKENAEAKKLYSILESYKKAQVALKENNIDEAKKILDGIVSEYSNYAIKEDIDLLKNQVKEKLKEVEIIQKEELETSSEKSETSVSSVVGYSKYSGTWVTRQNLIYDSPFGTTVVLNVNKDGHLQGSVGYSSFGYKQLASVDIEGTIKNNKFTCRFDEDGWGHSGTIQLIFKNEDITLITKYDSDSSGLSDCGLYKGTINLFKNTTSVKRTKNDLVSGGWKDILNTCFDVNINKYGDVKFLTESYDYTGYNFYLQDEGGNIVYKFPEFSSVHTESETLNIGGVGTIRVTDLNGNDLKDVIITFLDTDDKPCYIGIFMQKKDGTFAYDVEMEGQIYQNVDFKWVDNVEKYIRNH